MTVAMAESYAVCKACGSELPVDHKGACSHCGEDAGINMIIPVGTARIGLAGHAPTVLTTREFYEKNPKYFWLLNGLSVVAVVVGLGWLGLVGIVLAVAASAAAYFLSPKAITKVREITKH